MAKLSEGPLQVQAPVPFPEYSTNLQLAERGGKEIIPPSRGVGRRRIFVQTDQGDVLVVEVDRADGTGKVKRTVQAALNVPTEQAELLCGDQIVGDLATLQNDTPVFLRRGVHRSSSSPCLSAMRHVPSEVAYRASSPIDLVGGGCDSKMSPEVLDLVRRVATGLDAQCDPIQATGGLGGAYYFCNERGEKIAIVKPTDEEPFAPNNPNGYVGRMIGQPGLKKTVRVGEAGMREVAAFLLDHEGFSGVPPTALVRAAHPIFHVAGMRERVGNHKETVKTKDRSWESKTFDWDGGSVLPSTPPALTAHSHLPPSKICSMQKFVEHDYDASECGTSRFPVSAVHRIGILDVRLFNTDRHSGNILVRVLPKVEDAKLIFPSFRVHDAVELIPIDHGFALPEALEAVYFEWLHWPQASLPFSDEEVAFISSLDPFSEAEELQEKLPMLREGSLRVLVIGTMLLQRGAGYGLTLAEIGGIMSREVRGMEEEPSELEILCWEALRMVDEESSLSSEVGLGPFNGQEEREECVVEGEREEDSEGEGDESGDSMQFDFDDESFVDGVVGDCLEVEEKSNADEDEDSREEDLFLSPPSMAPYGTTLGTRPRDVGMPHGPNLLHHVQHPPLHPQLFTAPKNAPPSNSSKLAGKSELPSESYTATHYCSRKLMPSTSWRRFRRIMGGGGNIQMQAIGGGSSRSFGRPDSGEKKRAPNVLMNSELSPPSCGDVFYPGEVEESKWVRFVDVYSKLLDGFLSSYHVRRSASLQRMGTSCQF